MPGKIINRWAGVACLLLLLAACHRPVVPFRVVLRAPPMIPGANDKEVADGPVTLPQSPLLNRYDIVEAGSDVCPRHFLDYFGKDNLAWGSDKDTEVESANLISRCTELGPLEAPGDGSSISRDLLSFVHVTDVQLRRATAKLGDEKQSRGLDVIVDSFEHDFEQELYLDAVLEALVATINATTGAGSVQDTRSAAWPPEPRFVMHGGDSIDAGLESELKSFVRILDQLRVPWMDMIGNHDVLAFGNFLPGVEMSSKALLTGPDHPKLRDWYGKVLGWVVDATIKMDAKLDMSQCAGCADRLVAEGAGTGDFEAGFVRAHCVKQFGLRTESDVYQSRCRGFDLGRAEKGVVELPGYYKFTTSVSDGGGQLGFSEVLVIVLNTADFGEYDGEPVMRGGEGGFIGNDQVSWLDREIGYSEKGDRSEVLERHGGRMVLVFGHHPLATIRVDGHGEELEKRLSYLAGQDRLIGYFTGHKHRHRITLHCGERAVDGDCFKSESSSNPRFWEIETSSIIGFPQEARWVTLRSLGPRLGFIELVPFGHNVPMDESTPFRRALLRGAQGAERDACRATGCVRPRRTDGEHAAARLFVRFPKKPMSN